MAELVDAPVSKAGAERREGSSPSFSTIKFLSLPIYGNGG